MLWFENIEPPLSICTGTGGWRVELANATGLQLCLDPRSLVAAEGLGPVELDSRQVTVSETDLLWALVLGG
jgi:hypothetical protein